ncbi:MAG: Fic family protein [Proteobacteria bacterium]|nr:Fic family protein [Pseudomonadota bacterium]
MMSFRGTRLQELRLPQGTVWMLETLAAARGKQELYEHQSPQALKTLRELALIESVESSNRIEGVTVDHARLRPLVIGDAPPRDRPEEEIVGYRRALDWIHTQRAAIEMSPETCLQLHALAQAGTTGDAGVWKTRANDIIEIFPDGRSEVRFRPLAPELVQGAMKELFLAYNHVLDQRLVTPLVALAALILDFTCIHPFRDGNGRVSRLLFLLGLYHHDFQVGRYISLERVVEQTKEEYYATLKQSSASWHESKHDPLPWLTYLLSALRIAYRELEERASRARPQRGEKTDLVESVLENLRGTFGIGDVERLAPNVGRDMIRKVMNRWREAGKLEVLGRGRDARWKKKNGD